MCVCVCVCVCVYKSFRILWQVRRLYMYIYIYIYYTYICYKYIYMSSLCAKPVKKAKKKNYENRILFMSSRCGKPVSKASSQAMSTQQQVELCGKAFSKASKASKASSGPSAKPVDRQKQNKKNAFCRPAIAGHMRAQFIHMRAQCIHMGAQCILVDSHSCTHSR